MDEVDNDQPASPREVIQNGVAEFFEIAGLPYSYSKFTRAHLRHMRDWELNWDDVFSSQRVYCTDKASFVVLDLQNSTPVFACSFQLSLDNRYCAITHVERGSRGDKALLNAALAIDCAQYVAEVATEAYSSQKPFIVAIKNPVNYMVEPYKKLITTTFDAKPVWNNAENLLLIEPKDILG